MQVVKEVVNPDAQIVYKENTADDPTRRKPDITKARSPKLAEHAHGAPVSCIASAAQRLRIEFVSGTWHTRLHAACRACPDSQGLP